MDRETVSRSYDLFAPGLRDVWWYRCAVYGWRGLIAGLVYGFSAGAGGVMTGTPAAVMLSLVLPSFVLIGVGQLGLIFALQRSELGRDRLNKAIAFVGMIGGFIADLFLYEVLWLIRRSQNR